jgi:hypothetical protein
MALRRTEEIEMCQVSPMFASFDAIQLKWTIERSTDWNTIGHRIDRQHCLCAEFKRSATQRRQTGVALFDDNFESH